MNGCAVNDPLGAARSTWSSLAPTNALMATRPSPPGRFSTTIGWPQRLLNRSAISRVPISTPLPGPSVTMNLTARCGQVCAVDGFAARTSRARKAMANARRCMLSNGTSDVATQAQRAATRKQRCPAGILHHPQRMNDSTLALTTLGDVVWRLMFYAGPFGGPVHQNQQEKKARRVHYVKCFFECLMIAEKGASPVRASRISFPSG